MHLRWTYTLSPGSTLISTFSINDGAKDDIGLHSSGVTVVNDRNDYRTRFNISRSEVATLIIYIKSLKEKKQFTNASFKLYQTHGVTKYGS